jgi:hypothetical protein
MADIKVWEQNPLVGVGVGVSPIFRPFFGGTSNIAHTEYSRVLAEHGLLGVISLMLLGGMLISSFFKAKDSYPKGILVALSLWSLSEMAHAAMRLAAIPSMFAMAMMSLYWQSDDPQSK